MTTINLDAVVAHAGDFARKTLIDKGEDLVPMYVLYGTEPNTVNVVPCMWKDDSEKPAMIATVKHLAREVHAVAVSFIAEAWLSVKPIQTAFIDKTPPSEDPNRVELVFVYAADKSRSVVRSWQIVRSRPGGSVIALVEDHNLGQSDSRGRMLDGILP